MNTPRRPKYGFLPWLIWGLAATFFLAEYFARVAPSVMIPQLMHAFNANALTIGTLSAAFYYAYIAMQIPVGALVDALNTRWLLAGMCLLCGLAACLFCATNLLTVAILARALLGFAAAFAFVGTLKLAYNWFPNHRFGFLAGATQALGMLGAAIGEGPVALLVSRLGWRLTTLLIGLFLCVLAIFIALIVRDKNPKPQHRSIIKLSTHAFDGLRDVVKQPVLWINAVFIGFLFAPTQTFAELWGPMYLQSVRHLQLTTAAALTSLIFIGWAVGSPLAGWLSDRIQRRKPVLWLSAIGSLLAMSAILYTPTLGASTLGALLLIYGMCNVGVATSYAVAAESSPPQLEGTAMGFTNMASISIGAILQPLVGWILDRGHPAQHAPGHISYSAQHFQLAMSALPVCFVICLCACYFIRESHPKQ